MRLFKGSNCSMVQTVSKEWRSCTCGRCERKVELPHRWGYDVSATAVRVEGRATPGRRCERLEPVAQARRRYAHQPSDDANSPRIISPPKVISPDSRSIATIGAG